MKFTKITALLLVLCMMLSMVACADGTDDAATDDTNAKTADVDAGDTEAETEDAAVLYGDLPTGDFGGYEFRMLNNTSNFAYTAMSAEELTGEPINDAIYMRNKNVEDTLKITITENLVDWSVVNSTMNNSILANEDAYDVFWNESHFVAPFAIKQQLASIGDVTGLNLTKPWWNAQAMDSFTVADRLFFLVGDLHLMFNESFWMVGFNKNILDSYQLKDPYQLVRDGAWTLDAMFEDMSAVATDLDGDGKIDGSDQFGVTCYNGALFPLLLASGETIFQKDADDIPSYVIPGDRFFSVFEKIATYFFAPAVNDIVCMDGRTPNISQYPDTWHGVFSSGHALFYLEPIGSLKKLREMEAEFGIVPYPKYDEKQENYVSYVAHYAAVLGVPITNSDLARTGVILENLSAESHKELKDTYMKTTLNFKYIRDVESAEMLNIIFSTGTFELSRVFGLNAINDALSNSANNGGENLASLLSKSEKSANKSLEKTLAGLLGLE